MRRTNLIAAVAVAATALATKYGATEAQGAKAAVLKHRKKPLKPLVWKGPFVLEKRYFHTDVADQYSGAVDVERVDSQTVRIKGDDIRKIIYR